MKKRNALSARANHAKKSVNVLLDHMNASTLENPIDILMEAFKSFTVDEKVVLATGYVTYDDVHKKYVFQTPTTAKVCVFLTKDLYRFEHGYTSIIVRNNSVNTYDAIEGINETHTTRYEYDPEDTFAEFVARSKQAHAESAEEDIDESDDSE